MTRRLALLSLAAALLLTAALPAHAFRMSHKVNDGRTTGSALVACDYSGGFAHWDIRDIDWYVNSTSSEGSDFDVVSALIEAMKSWTVVDSADYSLSLAGFTSDGWATDDRNTLLWASGNGCTGNCLALTATVNQGQVISESDITFNADYTWNTDGSNYDVEAVAAHELGHSLGIHHTELTTTPKPTMKSSYFGTDQRSLEADDEEALQCSEWRYCLERRMKGTGSWDLFSFQQKAVLEWNTCLLGEDVDIFRNGVKVKTTANDGKANHKWSGGPGQAVYWVCEAGSTSFYDAATCSDQKVINLF